MSEARVDPKMALLQTLEKFETEHPDALDTAIKLSIRYRTLTKSQFFRMGPYTGFAHGTRLVSDTDSARNLRTKLLLIDNGQKHDLHVRQGEVIESALMKIVILGIDPKIFEYTRAGGTAIQED